MREAQTKIYLNLVLFLFGVYCNYIGQLYFYFRSYHFIRFISNFFIIQSRTLDSGQLQVLTPRDKTPRLSNFIFLLFNFPIALIWFVLCQTWLNIGYRSRTNIQPLYSCHPIHTHIHKELSIVDNIISSPLYFPLSFWGLGDGLHFATMVSFHLLYFC